MISFSNSRAGYPHGAAEVFSLMQHMGCEPDRASYNIMVDAYGRAGLHEGKILGFQKSNGYTVRNLVLMCCTLQREKKKKYNLMIFEWTVWSCRPKMLLHPFWLPLMLMLFLPVNDVEMWYANSFLQYLKTRNIFCRSLNSHMIDKCISYWENWAYQLASSGFKIWLIWNGYAMSIIGNIFYIVWYCTWANLNSPVNLSCYLNFIYNFLFSSWI